MEKRFTKDVLVFVGLVALIVAGRYLPHAANFTPAAAAGLFAAFWFRNRIAAVAVPLCGMLVSDIVVNQPYGLGTTVVVYASLALPALLTGAWMRRSSGLRLSLKVLGGTLMASALFFLSTNLAVWLWDGIYAQNLAGFTACYAAAVPFFKWTLAGDLSFATLLFGGYALWRYLRPKASPSVEAA